MFIINRIKYIIPKEDYIKYSRVYQAFGYEVQLIFLAKYKI